MSTPPEFLRSVLDGVAEASFVVSSTRDADIWHINESARRLFNATPVDNINGSPISSYLSFSTTQNGESVQLLWEHVTNPYTFVNNERTIQGIGVPINGVHFPVSIKVVRVINADEVHEETRSGQSSGSDSNCHQDSVFYCLYVRDMSHSQNQPNQQIVSLQEDIERLEASKDAILRASGQFLLVIDYGGSIQSVSSGISHVFGYDQDDELVGRNINVLLQGRGENLDLENHNQREVHGRRRDGGVIDLEVGFARISSGDIAIMIKYITEMKQKQRRELNDKISSGMEERSHILDAAFDPMFCTNKTGTIYLVNQAAVDHFGWKREELIGQNVSIVVGGSHQQHHDAYIKQYNQTGEKRMIGKRREIRCLRKDGTEFSGELGLAEIPTGFCGFIRKITRQKIYEHNMMKTEQKMAAQLKDQKNITQGILDASFDALFVINNKGIIQQANETATTVFGWRREELVGHNIHMIMTSDVARNHDQYLENYFKTGIKKMIGTQRDVTAQRKDKSTFPCVLGLSQIRDSGLFCGFIRDLSTEKAAQAEIIESHDHMAKILDASFDALFCINEKGIIRQINNASLRVFGWKKEELLGQNIKMIMPEGHASRHDSYLKHYIDTGFKKMMGKQREVEARKKDGSTFPCILGLSEVSCPNGPREFVGFIKDVTLQKSLLVAEAEREASDSLLHNILPEHIAHRLKQDPSHIADHYDNTTILFADIVGFTDRATAMSPHDVVTMLNDLFSRFDFLVDRYDLNKVKTIGDCYMVTSIPSSELEHDGCARVCRFALDLMKAVRAFNSTGPQHGHIELRVGIATGQVVAGVVGTKRFLFDMWGDAVNVAARMEQHGLPGQIQVTKEVVNNAGNDFSFECRGQMTIKGKGIMDTYLLKSAKDVQFRRSVYDNRWKPIRTSALRANSTNV